MANCESTDFTYPLLADVYYAIVGQSAYGDVNKQWILDRSVACAFAPASRKGVAQIQPNVELFQDDNLYGRLRKDLRIGADGTENAITNVLITNIRDNSGNSIYNETSGIRKGKTTLFEVAGNDPIVGPFGSAEYWRVIIRRSENQGVDV